MDIARISVYAAPCSEKGWITALVLMLLATTLGVVLACSSLVLFHLKSSQSYCSILQDSLPHVDQAGPADPVFTTLPAPEGWDSIAFTTVVRERRMQDLSSYAWRVGMREQYRDIPSGPPVLSSRPHIVAVIDDSRAMTFSSGRDYREDALYLLRPSGAIVHVSACSEVSDSHACAAGTYFSGTWGNSHQRSSPVNALTGAMPTWTHAFSLSRDLIASLDQCEVAVMTTSRGLVQPFSHDMRQTLLAMDGVSPASTHAPLAEMLYQASRIFPETCVTTRHILLVSAGRSVNDGHLPAWLLDYDHDGNPGDVPCSGQGCHCLDDVAAYCRSLGIQVHVVGPDTTFLRDVASKGGGRYMPGREIFAPEGAMVTAPLVIHQGQSLAMTSRGGRLDPAWIISDTGVRQRPCITNPLDLISCPDLAILGMAQNLAYDRTTLYCSTSADRLLRIDLSRRELSGLVAGMGGSVRIRGGIVLAGPDREGMVSCTDQGARILWQEHGTCMDASDSAAYLAEGSLVRSVGMEDGGLLSQYDTGHLITLLRFDPSTLTLIAGTLDGLIVLLTPELALKGMIVTGIQGAILEARPFTWRKEFRLAVLGADRVLGCTVEGTSWSASLDGRTPTGTAVLGGRVYIAMWDGRSSCGGIDEGSSVLQVMDAVTGELSETRTLFSGRAYGPSIDLEHGVMRFVSPSGGIGETDISSLPGIRSCPLGARISRISD